MRFSYSKSDYANPGLVKKISIVILLPGKCLPFDWLRAEVFQLNLRWPTTVTSKPNAHSKLKIAHIKFKSPTSNSNRSHQIQIAHSKFKSLTANYKSLTSNSNRSQQIQIAHSKLQIAHSKFKLLTSKYKSLTPLGVFGYLQPAVQLV